MNMFAISGVSTLRVGQSVPASYIGKSPGDLIGATITVSHTGKGGNYDVGFGIARVYLYAPPDGPPYWMRDSIDHFVYATVWFDNDSSARSYTTTVTGEWPSGLVDGTYDCFVFVIHPSRDKRTDGYGYNAGVWVSTVYEQTESVAFSSVNAEDWV